VGIEYTSVIARPHDEVFAWHERPGAMARLMPPWQPVSPRRETESLADGTAVLGLPGGVHWTARHNPSEYHPPESFVDELVIAGRVPWRHHHEFVDRGDGTTLMRDRVQTPVPELALRSMFAYRHRQLADDLAVQHEANQHLDGPLTVAITGAGGLVGTALRSLLTTGGHRVITLTRHPVTDPADDSVRFWDTETPARTLLSGVDVVVHLAGESIAGRFTDAHKAAIRTSRIEPTRALARAAADAPDGPSVFISASAIGYYGYDRGDEVLTETSSRGEGFLADVVADWEDATAPAADAGLRVVQVRTGIVQAARGGTLRLLRPLFAAGLGGRLGSGQQWLSWIGIDDLTDIYLRAAYDDRLRGPVNGVGPAPVRNTEYTAVLAKTLHRPALLPVPSFGPRLLLGADGVRELAEANQRVLPAQLSALGHRFRSATIADALAHQLGHED